LSNIHQWECKITTDNNLKWKQLFSSTSKWIFATEQISVSVMGSKLKHHLMPLMYKWLTELLHTRSLTFLDELRP
jgi:hypothetical protein